jgi:hypothetical protein
MFGDSPLPAGEVAAEEEVTVDEGAFEGVRQTLAKARRLVAQAPAEDADEMRELIDKLNRAVESGDDRSAHALAEQLDDLLFYLQDA